MKFRHERRLPEDFDDLPDDEQQETLGELESTVVSYDPNDLRAEISELDKLIREAKIYDRKVFPFMKVTWGTPTRIISATSPAAPDHEFV